MAEHWTIDDLRTVLDRPRGARLAPGEVLEDTPAMRREGADLPSSVPQVQLSPSRETPSKGRGVAEQNTGQSEGKKRAAPLPPVCGIPEQVTLLLSPLRTVSELNHASAGNLRAVLRRKRLQRKAAYDWLRHWFPLLPAQWQAADVMLTRIAPRMLDGDNLQASLKHCRDGVADFWGCDDRGPTLAWYYRQCKGKPKEYSVEIRLVRRYV